MISVTSLTHPKVTDNLRVACFNVLRKGYSVDHVRNSKGRAYIAVRRDRGFLVFTDRDGKDITRKVAKTLKRNKVKFS